MGSNIHSLSEFSALNRNQQNQYASTFARIPGGVVVEDPRDIRCIDFFFPQFTWKSFIVWVSVIQTIIFLATLIVGSRFLQPSSYSLSLFGSSYGPLIQKGQVYRLVMPIFLHASIWHILLNVFFQIRLGLPGERSYGILKVMLLYFISGIGGNLFSVAAAPCKYAVGASTAGFGLIAMQMAEMAVSWNAITNKDQATFNIVTFIVTSIMLSIAPHSVIDWRGHFGGFIAGFSLAVLYNRHRDGQPQWIQKLGAYFAITALAAVYIACTSIIFFIPMEGQNGRCNNTIQ